MDYSVQQMIKLYPYGVIVSVDGIIEYINPKAQQILSYPNPEILEGRDLLSIITVRDRKYFTSLFSTEISDSDSVFSTQYSLNFLTAPGTEIELHVSKSTSITFQHKPADVYIITSRSKEGLQIDELYRLNRSLYALTEVLEVSDEIHEKILLNKITNIIVSTGGYRMCWIAKIDPRSPTSLVEPIASSGFDDGYLENIQITWDETPLGSGPTGRSIRENKPILSRIIPDDEAFLPWKEEAIKRGYYSSLAIPLHRDDEKYGSINIYSSFPDAFSKNEIRLLSKIANVISRSLKNIKIIDEKRALDDELMKSNYELKNRNLELKSLYEISNLLNQVDVDIDEALSKVVEYVPKVYLTPRPVSCSIHIDDSVYGHEGTELDIFQEVEITVEGVHRGDIRLHLSHPEPAAGDFSSKRHYLSNLAELLSNYLAQRENLKKIIEQRQIIDRSQKLEIIGRLTGGLTHDLNNLNTTIMGYSDLLLSKVEQEHPFYEDLAAIRKSAERTNELAKQLLSFGKDVVVNPQVLDVNTQLQDLVDIIDLLIPSSIQISYNLCDHPLYINIDPSHFDQVILNLIINAKEAIKDDGGIEISTANYVVSDQEQIFTQTSPGEYMYVSVRDTGKGMSPEDQSKIFELFFTTKPYGTGLGLTNVKRIIERYHGYINVKSELDKFSQFEILLPLVGDSDNIPSKTQEPELRSIPDEILLIEDNEEVREFIMKGLSEYGVNVVSLLSPDDIKEYLEPNAYPPVIISDLVIQGSDITNYLVEFSNRHPGTKLLFMSGHGEEMVEGFSIKDLELNLIRKPFTIDQIISKLNSLN